MSQLQSKLKNDKIKAMKEKDSIAKSILSLLHSDAQAVAKKELRNIEDNDIIKSAKTLIKRNKTVIEEIKNKGLNIPEKLNTENEILTTFLPIQLTENEIKNIIDEFIEKFPEEKREKRIQGQIMKYLKDNHGDSVNMAFAAKYTSGKLN